MWGSVPCMLIVLFILPSLLGYVYAKGMHDGSERRD